MAFYSNNSRCLFTRRLKSVIAEDLSRSTLVPQPALTVRVPCAFSHGKIVKLAFRRATGPYPVRCGNQSEFSTTKQTTPASQNSSNLPVHLRNPYLQAGMPWRLGTSWVIRETWHTLFVAPFPRIVSIGLGRIQRTLLGEVTRDLCHAVYAARFLMAGFAVAFLGVNYVSHLEFEGRNGESCLCFFSIPKTIVSS